MQGVKVRSLVWEGSTWCGETEARVPQLLSLHARAREPQLLSPCAATKEAWSLCSAQEKPLQWEARARHEEQPLLRATRKKPEPSNKDPVQPKVN